MQKKEGIKPQEERTEKFLRSRPLESRKMPFKKV